MYQYFNHLLQKMVSVGRRVLLFFRVNENGMKISLRLGYERGEVDFN